MQIQSGLSYRTFLHEEFQKRQKKNASYSLRAYARDLEIPSSRLSEVLNNKVGLSEDRAAKLAEKLGLTIEEKDFFVDLVRSEHARSATSKKMAQQRISQRINRMKTLDPDQFTLVSDWHHFALLDLLLIEKNHASDHLAKRLGLPHDTLQASLDLMKRMGLLEWQSELWKRTDLGLTTTKDIASAAIRVYNSQILRKAEEALEKKPIQERDFSSIIFSLNKESLDYAKERIRLFRRELMNELESKDQREAVYCLSLQLFELTEQV